MSVEKLYSPVVRFVLSYLQYEFESELFLQLSTKLCNFLHQVMLLLARQPVPFNS